MTEVKQIEDWPDYFINRDKILYTMKNGVMTPKPQVVEKYIYYHFYKMRVKTKLYLHRLLAKAFVLGRTDEKNEVDHIDGNPLNNDLGEVFDDDGYALESNLRWVSHAQNMMNQKIPIHNTSGRKGVWFDTSREKWVAFLEINRKRLSKRFVTREEAENQRTLWEQEHFGEYARD